MNSFTGVSVADLTGGVFDATTLFQGNNFFCFAFQLAQQGLPAFVKGPLNIVNQVTGLVSQYFNPLLSGLQCPQLGQYDQGLFNNYPGAFYSPSGTAQNFKA